MDFNIEEYILKSRESGVSDNVIKTTLLNLGHSRSEVEAIFQKVVGAKVNESENYFTPTTDIQFGNQPAVPSVAEVAQKEEQIVQAKQKNKKILLIVAIVVLLFVGAGGGFAYYNYSQNLPANVLKKFNLAVPTISSFRNKLKITALVTPEIDATKQLEFRAELSGSFDFTTSTGIRIAEEISVSSEDFKNFSPIGLSFMLINKNIYLRSWDFSKFPFTDLSSLNGIWIKAGTESAESASSSPLGFLGVSPDFERVTGLKARFMEAMQDPPVNFVAELPGEIISNANTYHYLFNIDQMKLEEFLGKIGNLTEEEIVKAKEGVASKYANITTSTLEIWIQKGSYMPIKSVVTMEGKGVGSFIDSIKIENTFSDINSQLAISEPNNAKDLQEIMDGLMSQFTSNLEAELNSSSTIGVSTSTAPTSTTIVE